MQLKSGDKAKKSGDIQCVDCEGTVFMEQGEEVPNCPCGGTEFAEHNENKHSAHSQHSQPAPSAQHSQHAQHSQQAKKKKPA